MIRELTLENFKCIGNKQTFKLNRINVFSGFNGRGKSTVFQSLLLLVQSKEKYGDIVTLDANGALVSLGLYESLVNSGHKKSQINVCLKDDNDAVELSYVEKGNRKGKLDGLIINGEDYFNRIQASLSPNGQEEEHIHELNSNYPKRFLNMLSDFDYISAFRNGPTKFEENVDLCEHNPIGVKGEHILKFLAKNKHVLDKANHWLKEIMDGGKIYVKGDDRNGSVFNLYFSTSYCDEPFTSVNCGFGYSYILPIIILTLTKQNGALFIENPEAHLHPKAQSILMQMIAEEMNDNVQVFIETHSEHIINGLRLRTLLKASGKEAPAINAADVQLYFFDYDYSIVPITMDDDAQLDYWPEGFFDQQEIDLSQILKLGLLGK